MSVINCQRPEIVARMTPESALDAWDSALRGTVRFRDAHRRMGVPFTTWEKWYVQAAKAGDPRAVGREVDDADSGAGARRGIARPPGSKRG